ncbi:MAG: GNAT family N-acetyltransferase [Ilumatobacteraceae bacterium]|jgi:GNAT superfamily N-acetyltransferase
MTSPSFIVRRISLDEALPVRLDVLRRGTPARDAAYDGDHESTTVHIGAALLDSHSIVATSTWLVRPWPGDQDPLAVQLRGMAVRDAMQNTGVGRALIDAGIAHARSLGARWVWAKARDSALYFYERCAFSVEGEQFIEPASGVPHHLVVLDLGS